MSFARTNREVMQTAIQLLENSGREQEATHLINMMAKHPTFFNAKFHEPLFVLRATDKLARKVIQRWIDLAQKAGVNDEKVTSALWLHASMRKWDGRKVPD